MSFDQNVFINCPFDSEYKPILRAIVFTLVYLDYNPQLAETTNGAESRISGIQDLIESSKYSIHDLSRMQSKKKGEIARFNMPFELGIDIGCKRFGTPQQRTKCMLILDKEQYRYRKAISDLSGNDIGFHHGDPERAVREVRNWIRRIRDEQIDSPNKVWRLYNEFTGDFDDIAVENELDQDDIMEMPWDEYTYYIKQWVEGKEEQSLL